MTSEEKLLQEKIEDFEYTPSGGEWEQMESLLNENIPNRTFYKIHHLIGMGIAACLILFCGWGGLHLNPSSPANEASFVFVQNPTPEIAPLQSPLKLKFIPHGNVLLIDGVDNDLFHENLEATQTPSTKRVDKFLRDVSI